ncbi:MAG: hypothetical protein A2Z59_01335 [Nitrospinae bacterium RIFCSPLOWO2_02_39_17]|nr:MAG: hypothetical protein A3D97_01475 [Nitrospinae bacterium RIFCSPHIGHO2_12_FULL_39_42]OGW03654.1 MAG: hypothetical protein A2Z59_01335 [Nitrospinae bacterium RIFCSPLOWO2_02_39_17]OGW09927.1 MAG: hypothetical protein A2W75_02495 [Nitrospinae bacterium RIFCSPLOWO2_12_39_15]HLA48027.1 tetratricopeptide repeat protein [Nitrospinota bacterium]
MSNEQRATSLKKIFLLLITHCSLLIFLSCDDAPKRLFSEAEKDLLDGKYKQAIEKYNQILERYPRSGLTEEVLYRLGETYFLNISDIQSALIYFSELIAKGKTNKISYKSQKYIAQIYDEYLKNYDQAIIEYHKLIDTFKRWGEIDINQYNIAMCYFKKGDYDQATTEVKILLEKYPRSELSPDAMYLFANCKYLLGRCDEAITGYKKLIERYPISKYIVDAKYGIGMCLEEEEKLQEALLVYKEIKDVYVNTVAITNKINGVEERLSNRGR